MVSVWRRRGCPRLRSIRGELVAAGRSVLTEELALQAREKPRRPKLLASDEVVKVARRSP